MTRLGKFVTPDELEHLRCAHSMSGMWASDGTPFGDPAYEVARLAERYGLPHDTGLDLGNGEFISKAMPENPYQSVEYERFVASMVPHCHCAERYRPCDGVLAGGPCDHMTDERDEDREAEPDEEPEDL